MDGALCYVHFCCNKKVNLSPQVLGLEARLMLANVLEIDKLTFAQTGGLLKVARPNYLASRVGSPKQRPAVPRTSCLSHTVTKRDYPKPVKERFSAGPLLSISQLPTHCLLHKFCSYQGCGNPGSPRMKPPSRPDLETHPRHLVEARPGQRSGVRGKRPQRFEGHVGIWVTGLDAGLRGATPIPEEKQKTS